MPINDEKTLAKDRTHYQVEVKVIKIDPDGTRTQISEKTWIGLSACLGVFDIDAPLPIDGMMVGDLYDIAWCFESLRHNFESMPELKKAFRAVRGDVNRFYKGGKVALRTSTEDGTGEVPL